MPLFDVKREASVIFFIRQIVLFILAIGIAYKGGSNTKVVLVDLVGFCRIYPP